MLVGFAAYGVIWLVALIVVLANWLLKREISEPEEKGRAVGILLKALICALMAGAFGGGLFAVLSEQTKSWGPTQGLTFGVPLVLGIYLLTVTLYIGLMGRPFHDRWREWWGRLDGWLLLWGGAWLASFWMALCFPGFMSTDFVTKAWGATAANYLTPTSIVGTIGWVITTTVGLLRAKSSESSGKIGQTTWKDWFAKAAPCIFVLGLVCWLSYGIEWGRSHRFLEDTFTNGFMRDAFTTYRLWTALIGSVAVLAVMSWRVDINLFSMHSLYRNRLVRCFLGASNKREPDRFTGFDENDDMPLKDLRAENGYDGPYPVFNASLNLTKGQDLAWQERQAASFVMTPLYCGYDWWLEQQDSPLLQRENELKGGKLKPFGYRPTEDYAYPPPDDGLHLGAAMAISGAAVSPNSGYYTSPSVAFLLTLFNVRLGQWLGNPRHTAKWKRASPRIGFGYLLQELFTGSTDVSDYVNLSDGGHFDNMGLYEMVKRRCGLIIVCDAEEDRNYKYEGLGKAIRMCRIDMGIDIDLDVGGITPQEGKQSKRHFAVGKIHYAGKDLNAPAGTLVYFKASVTGDESIDVQMYQKQNTTFPHESTVDQWFSESQFEAYRKLGYDAIKNSLSPQPNAATDPLRRELHEVFSTFGFDTSLVARS